MCSPQFNVFVAFDQQVLDLFTIYYILNFKFQRCPISVATYERKTIKMNWETHTKDGPREPVKFLTNNDPPGFKILRNRTEHQEWLI